MSVENREDSFKRFLERHLAVIEPLSREAALASWEMQTTGSREAAERARQLRTELALIYADKETYRYLKELPVEALSDPLLKRQHTLLLHAYLSRQGDEEILKEIVALEVEIADTYNHYRARLRGKEVSDNELEQILVQSRDEALRKEAWEASKQIGAVVADRIRRLAALRNQEAQKLGYPNYYALRIELQELDWQRLDALMEELAHISEPLWNLYRDSLDGQLAERYGVSPEAIRPWHHANRFFQAPEPSGLNLDPYFADKNLEAITARFYDDIGLPIEDILARSDLYERMGKCQHAFCTDIDRLGDIRVLCNCRPNARWMNTMLHEFGHAAYDKYISPELPYLLRRPAHTMTTEAMALWAGSRTHQPEWLTTYADVPAQTAETIGQSARIYEAQSLLVFMRWCLVMYHFEQALYANPDGDLNTLWWDLVERYQRVRRPEERDAPDWAAKIHIATASVYYHNYLLGHLIAAQVEKQLEELGCSRSFTPALGTYLRERLFAPGALWPWEEWLQRATGEPLNPHYFVQQLQEAIQS